MSDETIQIPIKALREWADLTQLFFDGPVPLQLSHRLNAVHTSIQSYLPPEPLPVTPKPERWSITCPDPGCGKRQTWNDLNTMTDLFHRDLFVWTSLGGDKCQGCGVPLDIKAPAEVSE